MTENSVHLFDRALLRRRRDRAAFRADTDFLFDHAAGFLAERLEDVTRAFPRVLDLGSRHGPLNETLTGRAGTELVIRSDLSAAMLARTTGPAFAADEEWLPVKEESLDLIVSNLALHWANDLPGALIQISRALKPDGLFLATLLGGETLADLRAVLLEAEATIEGGAAPRVSPFVDVRDAGGLLQRAGFALPVADIDRVRVSYQSALKLMADLNAMGESNALVERSRKPLRRETLMEAARLYHARFGDGPIEARFDVVTLTGWAPHPDQQKPLKPGSAAMKLADALGTTEHPTGEKPGRG